MINNKTKLTIELVPKTAWNINVRSEVSKEQWNILRKKTYQSANYKCEICSGKGSKWPVECHEIWSYDENTKIQKLERLIALCPNCHLVKHYGRAEATGDGQKALKHLMKINQWTKHDAELYIEYVFELWMKRSQHKWTLDLSFLYK